MSNGLRTKKLTGLLVRHLTITACHFSTMLIRPRHAPIAPLYRRVHNLKSPMDIREVSNRLCLKFGIDVEITHSLLSESEGAML
jgi:hypothetical protein